MSDETDPRSSDEFLDEFLTLCDGGEAPEFEQWVRRYSDREDELREAYAEWTEGQEALEAASGKLSIGRIGPGTVVGDFHLIRLLGRGGQGTVWEASQASIGNRPVALKILSGASSEAAEARFAREGRAAGRLNHPGLVPVYDTGRAGDLSWTTFRGHASSSGRVRACGVSWTRRRGRPASRPCMTPMWRGAANGDIRDFDVRVLGSSGGR